jgi:hypothetical protein
MSMKNSNDTSWDRTTDLPICRTAHILWEFCGFHTWLWTAALFDDKAELFPKCIGIILLARELVMTT